MKNGKNLLYLVTSIINNLSNVTKDLMGMHIGSGGWYISLTQAIKNTLLCLKKGLTS